MTAMCVIANQVTPSRRWHPTLYRLAPMPGGVVKPARYKSKGHHTAGFATLDEANAHVRDRLVPYCETTFGSVQVYDEPIHVDEPGADVLLMEHT